MTFFPCIVAIELISFKSIPQWEQRLYLTTLFFSLFKIKILGLNTFKPPKLMVIFKKPHEMTGLTLRYETTSLLQLNYFSVILLKKKKKKPKFSLKK
jgi:hypothetical protein